jgi:hypothetical protein
MIWRSRTQYADPLSKHYYVIPKEDSQFKKFILNLSKPKTTPQKMKNIKKNAKLHFLTTLLVAVTMKP